MVVWFGSLSPHLPHIVCPLYTLPWWPNFWHLKHRSGFGMYCSIFSLMQPIFISLGVVDELKVNI